MDDEQLRAYIGTAAFLIAFVAGFDSSRWLNKRYNHAKKNIDPNNRPVLLAIVVASWMITGASGWIGMISAARLITGVILPWAPPITLAIATAIVFIPLAFRLAIGRVAKDDQL